MTRQLNEWRRLLLFIESQATSQFSDQPRLLQKWNAGEELKEDQEWLQSRCRACALATMQEMIDLWSATHVNAHCTLMRGPDGQEETA
jgi:hypothetical protein